MKKTYAPLLVLSLGGLVTACTMMDESKEEMMEEGKAAMADVTPSLSLADQPRSDGVVMIDALTLDKPGYVVIHKDADGKPGPVIGQSAVIDAGKHENYRVEFDASEAGAAVFPMLHYDNGDGVYEFPGPDGPVVVGGNVLVGKVTWQ